MRMSPLRSWERGGSYNSRGSGLEMVDMLPQTTYMPAAEPRQTVSGTPWLGFCDMRADTP
jgi:hypothetical protein